MRRKSQSDQGERAAIVASSRAALWVLLSFASPLAAQPDDLDRWHEIQAAGFDLYSNAQPEVALRVARGLEGFRAVFRRLAPDLDLDSVAPTAVFAFRNSESYAPYRHAGGRGGQVIGQFTSHPEGNAILLECGGERLDALPIIYHEAVHELVRLNFPAAPLWFHEGLAEYYSKLEIGDETIEIGAPVERHLVWLRSARKLGLDEIVRLPGDASALDETEHVGRVYAVSWALVHHLLSASADGRQRLADFLIALHEGLSPEVAFDVAFPQGVSALEEELRLWVSEASFAKSKLSVGELDRFGAGRARVADSADVLTRLGLLLARQRQSDHGERHFDLALAYDEYHPGALAGVAHLRAQSGRLEEAGAWFELALAAGDLGAEGWLHYGMFLLAGAEEARGTGRAAEFSAKIEEARSAFRASESSFPGFVEARARLGTTYLYDGDPRQGVEALVWARRRAPSRPDLTYYLALLYVRAEEFDRAEQMIRERLDPVEHDELVRQATEALERSRLLAEAERAFSEGHPDQGLSLLEQAIDWTTDPGLRRQLEARYEQLRQAHGRP